MRVFLLVFLSLYGGMQAYVFWKAEAALELRLRGRLVLAAFLAAMAGGPVLVQRLDRADWFRTAQAAGLVAYWWMPVSMWVVFFGVPMDLWNAAARLAGRARPRWRRLRLTARAKGAALAAAVTALTAWGAVEARCIRLETFVIRTPRLAAGSGAIRLVQISDLHLGLLVRRGRLERVLRLVREARPDVLVCTGDLVDGTGTHMEELAGPLAAVVAPLGKFAVTGNHEYYAGIESSLRFLKKCGFRVLRGESAPAGAGLWLAGVDDPAGRSVGAQARLDENAALRPSGKGGFTVLLKHRPDVAAGSRGKFDLQLSGHTHGGQIFPFTALEGLTYVRRDGLFPLGGRGLVYISRGAGTWGPPLRVLARPEVALFVIEPAGPSPGPVSSR